MQKKNLLVATADITVAEAARRMARKRVGALIVMHEDLIAGIFTERDIAFRVVARGLDPETTKVVTVMTPSPYTIESDEPFGAALIVMHDHGFRHLPVVEGGKLVGIVSARSAMDPELEEFESEAQRRKHLRDEHVRRRAAAAKT
ncbi:MAG: CBS domain-containing protein [Burkholderiales bacterium]